MTDQQLTDRLDLISAIVKSNASTIANINNNVDRLIGSQIDFSERVSTALVDLADKIAIVDKSIAIKKKVV